MRNGLWYRSSDFLRAQSRLSSPSIDSLQATDAAWTQQSHFLRDIAKSQIALTCFPRQARRNTRLGMLYLILSPACSGFTWGILIGQVIIRALRPSRLRIPKSLTRRQS